MENCLAKVYHFLFEIFNLSRQTYELIKYNSIFPRELLTNNNFNVFKTHGR